MLEGAGGYRKSRFLAALEMTGIHTSKRTGRASVAAIFS